jgi:hypothetical protein
LVDPYLELTESDHHEVINADNLSPPADEGPPVVDIDNNEASHIPVVVDEINPEVNSNVLNEEVEPIDEAQSDHTDDNAEPVINEEVDDDPRARALLEQHLKKWLRIFFAQQELRDRTMIPIFTTWQLQILSG